MQNLYEMGVKVMRPDWKVSFNHINFVSFRMLMHHWSSFRVTHRAGFVIRQCWCWQNNWSCTGNSPFTDCNKTHSCCKFWLHSLDMKPFEWCEWYLWPKMAFKMSEEFPTASLDITEDFCILHSAYELCKHFLLLLFHPRNKSIQLAP